jgi:drug/metabolite transporter (DMT)-like permease
MLLGQKAISIGLLAVASAAMMDAVAKSLSGSYSANQIVFFRFAFGLLPLLLWSPAAIRPGSFKTSRPFAQLMRGCLMFCGAILFFWGLKYLELAEAIAILFTEPLIVLVLAAIFLKEPISHRVIVSTAVGLLGIIVMVRPGAAVFRMEALLPFGAAVFSAAWLILTRSLGQSDQIATSTIYATASAAVLSVLCLPFEWATPSFGDLMMFGSLGFLGCLGTYLYSLACSQMPVSRLVFVDYSALIWAGIIGFLGWREIPDTVSVFGSLLIVCSGLFALNAQDKPIAT